MSYKARIIFTLGYSNNDPFEVDTSDDTTRGEISREQNILRSHSKVQRHWWIQHEKLLNKKNDSNKLSTGSTSSLKIVNNTRIRLIQLIIENRDFCY